MNRDDTEQIRSKYERFLAAVADACGIDAEVWPNPSAAALLELIRCKVGDGDKRIKWAEGVVSRWREAAEIERGRGMELEAEVGRLRAEIARIRDALGLVLAESTKFPDTPAASGGIRGVITRIAGEALEGSGD